MEMVECPQCDGRGCDGVCSDCSGRGFVFDVNAMDTIECPRCSGEGVFRGTCQWCGGTGEVPAD
jgi:DnaJ-class molecular chaperone